MQHDATCKFDFKKRLPKALPQLFVTQQFADAVGPSLPCCDLWSPGESRGEVSTVESITNADVLQQLNGRKIHEHIYI